MSDCARKRARFEPNAGHVADADAAGRIMPLDTHELEEISRGICNRETILDLRLDRDAVGHDLSGQGSNGDGGVFRKETKVGKHDRCHID
jgi:hypothetical protein